MSYYGYCNFNSIEKLVLDDLRVRKNRKQVYQFGKLLVLKSNRKTRRLIQKLGVVGKKVKTKGKRVSAYLVLSYTLSSPTYIIFSAASQNVLPFPNHGASIHKLRQRIEEINEINHKKSLSQIAILKELKFNKIVFTPQQYNEANQLFEQVRSGTLSMSDVALQIRGGDMQSIIGILVTILILNNIWTRICNSPEARNFLDSAEAFLQKPNQGRFPPHLQWLYGNNYQPGQFGYGKSAGPRSITVTEMTQNAGSDKKQPSSGSWNYSEVMRELDHQSSRKKVEIEVGDQIYTIKNPYRGDAYELGDKLADQIYDSIRDCDTDICDIAENLGFKADNIKNVKDHIFYNEHDLDRYGPDNLERKRFDPNLQQAFAWKRLEAGTHNQDDITWIKHECAERHHELKKSSGYNEAHNRAQTRFDGAPWDNQF